MSIFYIVLDFSMLNLRPADVNLYICRPFCTYPFYSEINMVGYYLSKQETVNKLWSDRLDLEKK